MDQLSNAGALYIAQSLVNSFSLQQESPDVDAFVDAVLEAMPLSPEQRQDLILLLNRQYNHIGVVRLRKYEIARIVAIDLLPAIDYPAFVRRLETSPDGAEILVGMNQFAASFNTTYSAADWPEAKGTEFRSFVVKLSLQLAHWAIDNVDECIEYFLTDMLYSSQFPTTPTLMDQMLSRQIDKLQFVTWDHLEIPVDTQERVAWNYAQEALQKIQLQKTPRDKVNCIFECFKILAKGLTDVGHSSADDFLPCVVFILLKANIPQLHSNLDYINTFRSPSEMGSQSGYFCVTIYAAAMFIENLTSEQLAIDQEFFRSRMPHSTTPITITTTTTTTTTMPHSPLEISNNLDNPLAEYTDTAGEKDLETYMAQASGPTDILTHTASSSGVSTEVPDGDTGHANRVTHTAAHPLFKDDIETVASNSSSENSVPFVSNSYPPDHPLHGVELEALVLALIAVAIANKTYDARIRVALRRMARRISIPQVKFLKLEERFVRDLAMVQNKPTASTTRISGYRIAKVLLAATAGGAALALTGGLAAPIVGHIFGVIGLSAIATALTTTTGVSGVAFVGILCGAAVTGGQMARKTAGLEEFDLLRVQVRTVSSNVHAPEDAQPKNPDVLDNIKQGLDDIIQKTKRLTTTILQKNSTGHTRDNEVFDTPLSNTLLHSDREPGASVDSVDTVDSNTESNDKEIKDKEAGKDAETTTIVFTDHSHGSKGAAKNTTTSSNASTSESLVIGPQNIFKGLHTIIGIPGWANKDSEVCVCDAWAKALYSTSTGFGDCFVLMWESHYLKKIGADLSKLIDPSSQPSNSIATKVAKKMVYHSMLSTTVLQEIAMVDSPWMLVRDRAKKAGVLLAQSLLNGSLGGRPTTLIGVSMGARVIFHCLEELCRLQDSTRAKKDHENKPDVVVVQKQGGKPRRSEQDAISTPTPTPTPTLTPTSTSTPASNPTPTSTSTSTSAPAQQQRSPCGIIENVIFIGAAVPADMLRFENIRRVVAGRIVNCYNPEDYTLSVIYRAIAWMQDGIHPPAGTSPIRDLLDSRHPPSSRFPIDNFNTQLLAKDHIAYQQTEVLTSILSSVIGGVF